VCRCMCVRVCLCVYVCVRKRERERGGAAFRLDRRRGVCVCTENIQVSFAKETYRRDYILQKRPIIFRSLLIDDDAEVYVCACVYVRVRACVLLCVCVCI